MHYAKTATALALALGLSAAAGGIGAAVAAGDQAPSGSVTGQPLPNPGQQTQAFRARANDLIDRSIVNQNGDDVGDLEDLVVDQNGRLYGVVEVGDVAGIGGKNILIPVEQLRIGQDDLTLMSQESEDALKAKPEYKQGAYNSIVEKRTREPMRPNP